MVYVRLQLPRGDLIIWLFPAFDASSVRLPRVYDDGCCAATKNVIHVLVLPLGAVGFAMVTWCHAYSSGILEATGYCTYRTEYVFTVIHIS